MNENIQKLATAILVYVPMGALHADDTCDVDILSLMRQTSLPLAEVKKLASSTVLARLVGADRTSFIQPEKKYSKKDKGAIRLRTR